MTEKQKKSRRWPYWVGGIVLLAAIAGINSPEKEPPKPKTEADLAFEAAANRAAAAVQQLRASSRNPGSFDLVNAEVMEDGSACLFYRAQNGFGGTNQVLAVLTPKDAIVTSESDGFTSKWSRHCKDKTGRQVTAAIRWQL